MKLKIEVEIPAWTQWLVSGLAMGIALGVGGAKVLADPVEIKTSWTAGDKLTAADLNANFKRLEDALNQLKHPDCPEDYVRDATNSQFIVCKNGLDEVVKVGPAGPAFWIDRYEVSVFDNRAASGSQYGVFGASQPYPNTFPLNGNYTQPLYALSMKASASGKPSTSMTWFQAQALCRLSGKRLPTGEEWLMAAIGTPDPGSSNGVNGTCLTNGTAARSPGLGTNCISIWGAEDMIGNVWEWSAEWYAGTPTVASTSVQEQLWPGADFGSDQLGNVDGMAAFGDNGLVPGLPAAAARGGSYIQGIAAGRFAFDIYYAPSGGDYTAGLRCVVPR